MDRLGARLLLSAGLVLWSLAQILGGLVSSFRQFIAVRGLLAIGESPQFPSCARIVTDWFAQRDRGLPPASGIARAVWERPLPLHFLPFLCSISAGAGCLSPWGSPVWLWASLSTACIEIPSNYVCRPRNWNIFPAQSANGNPCRGGIGGDCLGSVRRGECCAAFLASSTCLGSISPGCPNISRSNGTLASPGPAGSPPFPSLVE